jgi:hypothetical protein
MDLRIVARDRDLVCVSDKAVDKVIGYAVRFEDGSWANLRSRRYSGSAPGRVFFLTAPPEPDDASASARREELGRLVGLSIGAGGGADVVVTATDDQGAIAVGGDTTFADAVEVDGRAGHYRVAWQDPMSAVPELDETAPGRRRPVVRCLVPRRCRLRVDAQGTGHVWIAAPDVELHCVLGGEATLVCEQTVALDIELRGSGGAFFGRARGRARMRTSGPGSAIVAGGRLAELDATVAGSGSIVVHAPVGDAVLTNTGSGALSVPSIDHLAELHDGAGPLLAGVPMPADGELYTPPRAALSSA